MAYVKLHYGITDFWAGYQTINQMRDNLQAVYDAYAAEHSFREPEFGRGLQVIFPPLAEGFGRHNTPKIPRAALLVSLATSSFSVVVPASNTSQPVVTALARFATGVYFIGISGLVHYFAEVEALQLSTGVRLVLPRTSYAGVGAPAGIIVECYEKASVGGGFDLADFDFSAIIYGTTS